MVTRVKLALKSTPINYSPKVFLCIKDTKYHNVLVKVSNCKKSEKYLETSFSIRFESIETYLCGQMWYHSSKMKIFRNFVWVTYWQNCLDSESASILATIIARRICCYHYCFSIIALPYWIEAANKGHLPKHGNTLVSVQWVGETKQILDQK